MSKKTLTGVLAGVLSLGVVTPAMATEVPNIDALNKAAYEAVVTAQKEGTQASINKARIAVQALKEAKPDSEHIMGIVRNYSSALDKVQHPILSAAITATLAAEKSGTQADINAAFKVLPTELLELDGTSEGNKDIWRNKYRDLSSILDKAQVALQTKTSEAVKKAQDEKTPEAIEAAQKLVSEVATSDKEAIQEWAKIMQERLDAIVTFKLDVKEVTEITKTSVTVKFDKLAEELNDVTVVVKDAKGNVVPVKEEAYIEKDATSFTFTFEKALDAEPAGAWTVNGVGYDATARTIVNTVKEATTEQQLADALTSYEGFTGYNVNNAGYYFELLAPALDADKIKTIEDIQVLIIDAGNENAKKESLVPGIVASPNEVALGENMIKAGVKRVNKAWLKDYNTDVNGDTYITGNTSKVKKFSDIQARIDSINMKKIEEEKKVVTGETATVKIAEVNDFVAMVDAYHPEDDTDDKKAKEALLATAKTQASLIGVLDAETPQTVISALKKLASADKTFKYTEVVNENLGAEYVKHFNIAAHSGANTITDIEEEIKHANGKAVCEALKTLNKTVTDINIDIDADDAKAQFNQNPQNGEKIQQVLNNLENATGKTGYGVDAETGNLWDNDKATPGIQKVIVFDPFINNTNETLNFDYYREFKAGALNNVAGVEAKILAAQNNVIKTTMEDYKTDAANVLTGLQNVAENFGLKNVNNANREEYVANVVALTTFEEPGFEKQLIHLQRQVDKVNAIAVITEADSTLEEVTAAVNVYRNIDVTEGTGVIPATITSGQLADVAQILDRSVIDHEEIVEADFKGLMTGTVTVQENEIKGINDALTRARNVKYGTATEKTVVIPEYVIDINDTEYTIIIENKGVNFVDLTKVLQLADSSIDLAAAEAILDNFSKVDINGDGKVTTTDVANYSHFGQVRALNK